MRRTTDEHGFTLIEVLIAASIMLIVLTATMTLLGASNRQQQLVEKHNEAQQQARTSLDRVARDLRNLASGADLSESEVVFGSATLPRSVERSLPYDLVFRTIDDTRTAGSLNATNVKRVRYCLDTADPNRARMWQQTQTWTTAGEKAMPTETACPLLGAGWDTGKDRVVAASVVNRSAGRDRAIFRYSGDVGAIAATDVASRATITRLRADLFVDADALKAPAETHLATAVFLRNQNREPISTFQITPLNYGTRLIELNGTASEDPEGRPLREYQFYVDPPSPLPVCSGSSPHASCLRPPSPRAQYVVPDANSHVYVLKVTDPAGLVGISRQEYTLP